MQRLSNVAAYVKILSKNETHLKNVFFLANFKCFITVVFLSLNSCNICCYMYLNIFTSGTIQNIMEAFPCPYIPYIGGIFRFKQIWFRVGCIIATSFLLSAASFYVETPLFLNVIILNVFMVGFCTF